jgi:hypothetical protein
MRPTDQLLVSIVSGEAALIVSLLGWSMKRATREIASQRASIERIASILERHLAWHDGLGDREAGRGSPVKDRR